MITKYITIKPPDYSKMEEAAEALCKGELVAFPTETVYGLGADALNEKAVQSIFSAKGRPSDNPLIVHIAQVSMLKELVSEIKPEVDKLIRAFWPGPLTLVCKKSVLVPAVTTAGLDTVAVRMPDHPIALALIRRSGVPVAAPSANRSGKPSPTLGKHVLDDLNGRVSWIIDGGPCRIGLESTVLDVTGEKPSILRPGGITKEMIEQLIGKIDTGNSIHGVQSIRPKSPGLKYTHYAPRGEVIVVSGKETDVSRWINQSLRNDEKEGVKSVVVAAAEHMPYYQHKVKKAYGGRNRPEEIAANIFRIFRECDRLGFDRIYVEAIPKEGIGDAVMNRIEKAAGGRIVHVNEEKNS